MNLDLIDFLAVWCHLLLFIEHKCDSLYHYNLWFLFAYYHKRNGETKRLKAVSSSRPLSAILTQVGHYTCRTEARKEGEKEMLTSGTKTVPDITSLSYKYKYQQLYVTTTQHSFYLCFILTFYYKSWDIFTSNKHLLQMLHKSINCDCDHYSHTWWGFMTSTKVTLEI